LKFVNFSSDAQRKAYELDYNLKGHMLFSNLVSSQSNTDH